MAGWGGTGRGGEGRQGKAGGSGGLGVQGELGGADGGGADWVGPAAAVIGGGMGVGGIGGWQRRGGP